MSRRRPEAPGASGFLVVDKPRGWTSHDVVDAARRLLGTRRVGHLGTLDPLATGVLPLAVREATKLAPFLASGEKVYTGEIELGAETDTLDADGRVVRRTTGELPSEQRLREALAGFVGEVLQVPPMYSAVKREGVPLHRLARAGREVARAPKKVRIHSLVLLEWTPPRARIEVRCSAGTYVRSLAADLGRALGCGGFLASLRRTRSGPFGAEQALPIEQLEAEAREGRLAARLIPPVNVLGLPVVRLEPPEERRVRHGGEVTLAGVALPVEGRVAAVGEQGELVAILEIRPGRRLQPLRVLQLAGLGRLCHTPAASGGRPDPDPSPGSLEAGELPRQSTRERRDGRSGRKRS
jgi:tRNA pseudouridine55 synthase